MTERRNVPATQPPIDRAALERVLARAAELQARIGDAPDNMSEAELMALGNEVGIGTDVLRQALAEERTRAYAIYLLTRQGIVTTNFAAAVQKRLEANHAKTYAQDIVDTVRRRTAILERIDIAALCRQPQNETAICQPEIFIRVHNGTDIFYTAA